MSLTMYATRRLVAEATQNSLRWVSELEIAADMMTLTNGK